MKTHNIIWLQDEDVNENYEGVTWCSDKIEDNDTKYIKVDYLKALIDGMTDTSEVGVAAHSQWWKGYIKALQELKEKL